MLTGMVSPVEKIPQLGALIFGVPLAELVPMREKALLGTGLLLVAAAATETCIEFLSFNRIEQRHGLEGIAGGKGAFLLFHAARIDGCLHGSDHQTRAEFFRKSVAIFNGLGEVVAGVHMEQRKWNFCRPESLTGQMSHHDRILTAGKKQRGVLKLRGGFTKDVDGLRFDLVQMVERISWHV